MRRWVVGSLVGTVALFVLSAPAAAQTVKLVATLQGTDENPVVLSGAFGSAEMTVDLAARTISYRVDVFNLPSGVTGSHIHVGPKGVNGPIILFLDPPLSASNDFGFSGTVTESILLARPAQGIRSMDDAIQSITGGSTYVNVHSTVFPGGEIRGQLVPLSASFVPAYVLTNTTAVTAAIDGGQENPGIVTGALGTATFTLNAAARTIAYDIRIFNVPSGTVGTHIHVGPRGVNGPIILPISSPTNISNDFVLSGTLTQADFQPRPDQGVRSIEDAFESIAGGVTYFNLHTAVNPPGEMRGQIVPR